MKIDSGDTAWLLASAALVLFMTPGLAFFYGGMVRSKNVLAMLMQNYVTIGLVSVVWAVVSYSLAFGADIGGGLLGGLHFAGLAHQGDPVPGLDTLTVPPLAFVAFQMMFAIITPALITGALADRVKFGGFVLFVALWSVFVYAPVAHWVFSPTGWLNKLGALDFAGGTVVHANAGAAALAVVLVIGKRRGWPREQMKPHSLPLTLLGAGILWFGWFGFNAGSALAANGSAAQAFVSTQRGGVAVAQLLHRDPGQQRGRSRQLGADERLSRRAVGRQRGTGVEAKPAEPQDPDAEQGQRHAVRLHLRARPASPLTDHQHDRQRRGPSVGVHDGAAGEVQRSQLVQPSGGREDPVRDRRIDEHRPQGHEQHEAAELHPVRKRAGDQRRRNDREHHLEGHEGQWRNRQGVEPGDRVTLVGQAGEMQAAQ